MKEWLGILFFLIILLQGCAKKEVPPVAVPQPDIVTVKPSLEEVKEKEKKVTEELPERVFKEEKEDFSEREDWEIWKLYGRGTPPLLAIFFDFDDYSIRKDMWDRITHNVKYLLENKHLRVELQGNCDERGTNEYNLALGLKRAQEVKKVLVRLGVEEDRITTVSFGEERPLAKCSNETCWAINRRVDFVILK